MYRIASSLEDIIKNEAMEFIPNSYLPKVIVTQNDIDNVSIHYESNRKMCSFLEGLIAGCAEYFNEEIEISHPVCAYNGYTYCLLNIMVF